MNGALDIAPALIELANGWPVRWDTTTRPVRTTTAGRVTGGETVAITRCVACGEEIFHGDGHLVGTLRHLMNSHGYRMDGRQFDNQNRLVGRA